MVTLGDSCDYCCGLVTFFHLSSGSSPFEGDAIPASIVLALATHTQPHSTDINKIC